MIVVDGAPRGQLDPRDRGFAYGDGVFRTLRVKKGTPLWWRDHWEKLAHDCAALGLACPAEGAVYDEVRQAAGDEAAVKIVVTRGVGARGYAPGPSGHETRVVIASPLPAHAVDGARDVRARWCQLRLSAQPRLAGIKHLNRLENVLARGEWDDPEIVEGLLCDRDGAVIGGVMSNVFWASAGELFTPDLDACGVAGVARTRLLRAAARRGIRTRVERAPAAVILAADEVMICNSLIGVRRVARLDEATWTPAGWTEILDAALYEDD